MTLSLELVGKKVSYQKRNWLQRLYYLAKDGNPRDILSIEVLAKVPSSSPYVNDDVFVDKNGYKWIIIQTLPDYIRFRLLDRIEVPHPGSQEERLILMGLIRLPIFFRQSSTYD